jgi:hypothetical protein
MCYLWALIDKFWDLLNSNFSTALLGAFGGAVAAQIAAARSDRKKRLIEEIRSTNAAITVAFSITNSFCNLKTQHVKKLTENYQSQKTGMLKAQKARTSAPAGQKIIFEFKADFRSLPSFDTPIKTLETLLFEKLSITGRPLSLVTVLSQSIDGLNAARTLRNSIIEKCKSLPEGVTPPIYFGLPFAGGHVDSSYPDCIGAIATHTDDCIFFSKLIGEDLVKHGEKLAKQFGRNAPKIVKSDFSNLPKGIIPEENLYSDWIKNFKKS